MDMWQLKLITVKDKQVKVITRWLSCYKWPSLCLWFSVRNSSHGRGGHWSRILVKQNKNLNTFYIITLSQNAENWLTGIKTCDRATSEKWSKKQSYQASSARGTHWSVLLKTCSLFPAQLTYATTQGQISDILHEVASGTCGWISFMWQSREGALTGPAGWLEGGRSSWEAAEGAFKWGVCTPPAAIQATDVWTQ